MKEKKNSKGEQSSKSKSSTASIEEPRKQRAKKKKEKEKEDDQMKFGRRMFDDDINTFFDYIQQAAGPERAFEGPCAIQLFSVDEPVANKKVWWKRTRCCWDSKVAGEPRMGTPFFPGKKISCQVLLDQKREHFVLISYDPRKKCVHLYDSLYKEGRKHIRHFPKTICYQICSAYGHLAEDGKLIVRLETDYETQDDEWSCGYRCVGAVLAMYREIEPATISYDLPSIYEFFMKVIDKDQNGNHTRPSWNDIMATNIGSDLEKKEIFYIPVTLMVNEPGYGLKEAKASADEEMEDDEQPNTKKENTSSTGKSATSTTTRSQTEDETWKGAGRLRSGKDAQESKKEAPEEPYCTFPLKYFSKFSGIFK